MNETSFRPLWAGFLASADLHPARPALNVGGEELTYGELVEQALKVAATIQSHPESATGLVGVFAYRSQVGFAGILGALLAGNGYVPLNRTFPADRTELMFRLSGSRIVVVDQESLPLLPAVLEGADDGVVVVVPDLDDPTDLSHQLPQHTVVGRAELLPSAAWRAPEAAPSAPAYLLFTSGSTGVPKGVAVSHSNVRAFLDHVLERYEVGPEDRLSQMFDPTFDLSVFDMFVAWESGACLCCPSQKALISPARFVRDMQLTIWFSVPSTAIFMKKLGALKANAFPTLRWSLFCGEPLPVLAARAWAEAAPNSVVENLYGPTEVTIACSQYRWQRSVSEYESEIGIVPIGDPYPALGALVVDSGLNEVAPGEIGELLMRGPQVTDGYWKDCERTTAAFVVPPGHVELHYRTGDRVRRPLGDGPFTHHGRMDSQIKIRGYRVELGEVEAAVRAALGYDGVVAVPWPATENGYDGIEVFIEGIGKDADELRMKVASKLPHYMVPRRFHFLSELPLNVNGKYDRAALAARVAG